MALGEGHEQHERSRQRFLRYTEWHKLPGGDDENLKLFFLEQRTGVGHVTRVTTTASADRPLPNFIESNSQVSYYPFISISAFSYYSATMEVGIQVVIEASTLSYLMLSLQSLIDFSREFDVGLMDKVVMAFYTGIGQEVGLAASYQRMI